MKSTIKILLLIISGLSVYFHYHNNVSSEIQRLLYEDLKNGIFKEESTARFHVLNLEFPNLSLSSIPMKALVARYYFLGAQYDKALELLAESDNVNPYIMYNESLKQDIYFNLGEKDSVLYYAEKSFTGIPNNHKHFIDLARAYRNFDRYHLIDSIFEKVEKSKISDIWKFYFAGILTKPDSISNYGKQKAVEAINLFGDSDFNLKISALYVIYGAEQIDKSLDVEIEATDLYIAEKYRDAAIKYEEAINLNPIEYTHYENAGISNYKFGYYDRAITQLKYVIDSLNPKTGKSEFIIANVYNELEDYDNACKYIYLSSKFDYKASFRLIGEYCK